MRCEFLNYVKSESGKVFSLAIHTLYTGKEKKTFFFLSKIILNILSSSEIMLLSLKSKPI